MMSLGLQPAAQDVHDELAGLEGDVGLRLVLGGNHRRRPSGVIPRISKAIAIVLAVNWPPQAPAPGLATPSSSCRSLVAHLAGRVRADGLEDLLDRDVVPSETPGRDRAAVEHHGGHVEARERHDGAGDRLVAAREGDDGVEEVAATDELDRVGDHLAADERGLHPARAHRDAVADRDRVQLHRRAAGGADALLDLRGERAQMEVAGHRLDPRRGDADDRLASASSS